MRAPKLALLLLLLPLVLSGCADDLPEGTGMEGITSAVSSEEEPEGALPSSFSLPWDADAPLDPVTCPDGIQQTVGSLLYEGLFELDTALEPQYRLCTSAAYDPETLTWTLQLRSGVTFSDGSALTARDAVYTLQRAQASDRYRARLSAVQSISDEGNTLSIALSRPNTALTALLDIPIVKAGTADQPVPLGTGPYTLVRGEENSHLAARSDWWGGHGQPVSRIELLDCANSDSARYQFTSHAVQLITADLTGTAPLSATGSFTFRDADTTAMQYIGFNLQRSLLTDPAVRRALSLGIDRNTVAGAYLSGHALAAQFPLSPVSPLYPTELEDAYSYSAFAHAMDAAGLNSGAERHLTLLVNEENSFKVSAARYIAASLSAFDLKITVKALPWADYLAALAAGDYDLYYAETRLTADWDMTALTGTGGSLNYSQYSDPVLDQLMAGCASSQDRASAINTLCARMKQQAPILPVCFKRTSVLTQSGVVEGLTPTAADPFHRLEDCTIHLVDET